MRISDWSSDVCSSDLRLLDQITIHLGAARSQSEFLAEMIGRGEIGAKDRENLADALLGALAAAPQVTGIGYFSVEGWSLRVGRGQRGLVRLFNPQEPEPAIRRMVATMAPDAGPEWGGGFWVENLSQAHLTISTPVTRDGRLLAVISSVEIGRAHV